jgi:hypothetical protein
MVGVQQTGGGVMQTIEPSILLSIPSITQSSGQLLTTFWQSGYVPIHEIGTGSAIVVFQAIFWTDAKPPRPAPRAVLSRPRMTGTSTPQ